MTTIKTVKLKKKTNFNSAFKAVLMRGKVEEILAYGKTEEEALRNALSLNISRLNMAYLELEKFNNLRETLKSLLGLEEINETIDI